MNAQVRELIEAQMRRPWRHTVGDGRGYRRILVDGVPVDRVYYTDVRRGLVIRYARPFRLRGGRVQTEVLRGEVCVEYL